MPTAEELLGIAPAATTRPSAEELLGIGKTAPPAPKAEPTDLGGFFGQAGADLKSAGGAALSGLGRAAAGAGQIIDRGIKAFTGDTNLSAQAADLEDPSSGIGAALRFRPGLVMGSYNPAPTLEAGGKLAEDIGNKGQLAPGTATNEGPKQRYFREKIAPAAGGLLGFGAAAAISPIQAALYGGLDVGETARSEAERAGASEGQQTGALAAGFGLGTTAGLIPGGKGTGGLVRRLLTHAGTGAAIGAGQRFGENEIAKDLVGYDPNRSRGEGVLEAGAGGAVAGGVMGGIHEAFSGARRPKIEAPTAEQILGIAPEVASTQEPAKPLTQDVPIHEPNPVFNESVRRGVEEGYQASRPMEERVRGAVDDAFFEHDPQEGQFGAEPEPNPLGTVRPETRRAVDQEAELQRQPSEEEIRANLAENSFDQGAGRGYGIAEEDPQGGYSPVVNNPSRRIDTDFADLDPRFDRNAGLPQRIAEPARPWEPHQGPDPSGEPLRELEREIAFEDRQHNPDVPPDDYNPEADPFNRPGPSSPPEPPTEGPTAALQPVSPSPASKETPISTKPVEGLKSAPKGGDLNVHQEVRPSVQGGREAQPVYEGEAVRQENRPAVSQRQADAEEGLLAEPGPTGKTPKAPKLKPGTRVKVDGKGDFEVTDSSDPTQVVLIDKAKGVGGIVKPKSSVTLYGGVPLPLKEAYGAARKVAAAPAKLVESQIERIGRQGGEAGRETADRMRKTVEVEQSVLGELRPAIKANEDAHNVGVFGNKEGKEARKWADRDDLSRPVTLPNGVKVHNNNGKVLAERAQTGNLPPAFQKLREAYKRISDATGEALARHGYLRADGTPFKGWAQTGGRGLVRLFTPEARHWLARGAGPEFNAIVDGMAHAAGVSRDAIEAVLTKDGFIGGKDPERRVGFVDERRSLKDVPSGVTTPGGRFIPLLETDIATYTKALAKATANRIGFQQGFGHGSENVAEGLLKRFKEGNGDTQDWEQAFQSLQGRGLGEGRKLGADPESSSAPTWARAVKSYAGGAFSEGALSMSAVANAVQTPVLVPASAGTKNYVKAVLGVLSNPRQRAEGFREMGAIHDAAQDFFMKRGRGIEDSARNVFQRFNPLHQLTKTVNDFNDFIAAAAHQNMVNEINADAKAGRSKTRNVTRLEALKFTPSEIDSLLSGKAPQRLQNEVVRRGVTSTQFSGGNKAEYSALINDPKYRLLTQFQRYASGTANKIATHGAAVEKAILSKDAKKIGATIGALTASVFGMQVSGEVSHYLRGVLTGMDPSERNGFWNNLLDSGIMGSLRSLQYTSDSDPLPVKVAKMIPAGRAASNVYDAIVGNGTFRDLPPSDRALKLLTLQIPITKVGRAFTVAQGLRDPKIDTAIGKYYDYLDSIGEGRQATEGKKADAPFRVAMRAAVEAMRNGDDKKAVEHLNRAVEAKGARPVIQSIKARMFAPKLANPKVRDFAAKNPEAVESLKKYDALLMELVKAYGARPSTSHAPGPDRRPVGSPANPFPQTVRGQAI